MIFVKTKKELIEAIRVAMTFYPDTDITLQRKSGTTQIRITGRGALLDRKRELVGTGRDRTYVESRELNRLLNHLSHLKKPSRFLNRLDRLPKRIWES